MIEEKNKNNKYDSVLSFVNLPPKRTLKSRDENLFLLNLNEEIAEPLVYVTPGIRESRDQLVQNIETQIEIYEDTKYLFEFPPSKFADVAPGDRNNISYQQKIPHEEEDTFKPKLTSEQIDQMKKTGEFEVKSANKTATIPYVWKINDCILRGRKNILSIWENGLANCYGLMVESVDIFVEVIPKNLKKLAYLPVRFFSLIYGKKSLRVTHTPNYEALVYIDFWTDIMNNDLKELNNEVSHEFLGLLYVEYEMANYRDIEKKDFLNDNLYEAALKKKREEIDAYAKKKTSVDQLKSALVAAEGGFEGDWKKIRKRVLNKVSLGSDENEEKSVVGSDEDPLSSNIEQKKDKNIIGKFEEEKFLLYTAHMKEHLPKHMNTSAVNALMYLLTIFNIIQSKLKLKANKVHETSAKTISFIIKNYPIRSKNSKFYDKKFNEIQEPINKRLENELNDSIIKELSNSAKLDPKYESILKKYISFCESFNQRVEHKKTTQKLLHEPSRVFKTTYLLIPPFEVENPENSRFHLKKKKIITIDTSTHFWKCKLYAMRIKSWTINCFIALLGLSWVGPFGLRCLCGADDFTYDEDIDYGTGEKKPIKRTTVLGKFGKVLRGISKSRANFEQKPDRGLFGKNFSRICNILECYIFRFFFVGIIGVLILYPLLIIVISTLCIIFMVTVWIWVPIVMILVYLFNILIFQFETSTIPDGIIIRSVPLISLLIVICLSIAKILLAILLLFVIAPLLCILYFLFLVLQRVLRTISDTIMLCFISCCGRTPSYDTSIAKKISGPGMSRSYYFSIAEEDVYILTQCALERMFINKFIELTKKEISNTSIKMSQIFKFILKPFGVHNYTNDQNLVSKNKNELQQNFTKQCEIYLARYPSYPNQVRFTQEEIDIYFENSLRITKNFVEREKIQNWIFEEKQMLFEDYEELTREIWKSIFNCGEEIFEPLEKIDSRFKLDDNIDNNSIKMKESVNQVMKALEGEIELASRNVNITPAKTSLLEKDEVIRYVERVCHYHTVSNAPEIFVDIYDPSCVFVAPQNLSCSIEVQKYRESKAKGKDYS